MVTWYIHRGRGGKFEHLPGHSGRVQSTYRSATSHTANNYICISYTIRCREKLLCYCERDTRGTFGYTTAAYIRMGRRFTVRTGHKPLTSILTTKGFASDRTSQRINKWSTLLLEYNFDIQYIRGVNNTAADCMSWIPLQSLDEDFTDDDICTAEVSDITNGAISTQQFQGATQEDSTLLKAISYMHSQWPVRKSLQGDMEGLLYLSDQLVVQESFRHTILQHAHKGHFGMTLQLRQHYWWPELDKQVEHLVRDCHMCAFSDKPYRTYQAPMTPTPPQEGLWPQVAMDIIGPFKTMNGKYAIVLVDYFSKWCEVEFVTDITTSRVIKFLQSVFVREDYSIHIVMDNGVLPHDEGLFHRAWNRTLHYCTVPSSR